MAADSAIENVGAGNGPNHHVGPLIRRHAHARRTLTRPVNTVCEERTLELVGFAPFVDDRETDGRWGRQVNRDRGEPKILRRNAHRLGVSVATRQCHPHDEGHDLNEVSSSSVHDPLVVMSA